MRQTLCASEQLCRAEMTTLSTQIASVRGQADLVLAQSEQSFDLQMQEKILTAECQQLESRRAQREIDVEHAEVHIAESEKKDSNLQCWHEQSTMLEEALYNSTLISEAFHEEGVSAEKQVQELTTEGALIQAKLRDVSRESAAQQAACDKARSTTTHLKSSLQFELNAARAETHKEAFYWESEATAAAQKRRAMQDDSKTECETYAMVRRQNQKLKDDLKEISKTLEQLEHDAVNTSVLHLQLNETEEERAALQVTLGADATNYNAAQSYCAKLQHEVSESRAMFDELKRMSASTQQAIANRLEAVEGIHSEVKEMFGHVNNEEVAQHFKIKALSGELQDAGSELERQLQRLVLCEDRCALSHDELSLVAPGQAVT